MFGFELYQTVDGVRYISSRHEETFPLKKPDNTIRIVCFGGSTTENSHSFQKDKTHYPLVLQSILQEKFKNSKFEVINVGNSAYATPHSLILLELDVLSWKPDFVILSHNINDLTVSYWPDLTFDYSNKYSDAFYAPPGVNPGFDILEHSRLITFLQSRYYRIMGKKKYPIHRKSLGDNPSPLAGEIFNRNIRSFVSLARSNGIQVVLGTQALQPKEEMFIEHMQYKPYNEKVTYPKHEEFVKHHGVFNEIIRNVSRDTGVLLADNDSALGGNEEYFFDFVHYTKKGVERLAQNYADVLSKSETFKQLTQPQ